MSKRVISIITLVAMSVSLVACGSKEKNPIDSTPIYDYHEIEEVSVDTIEEVDASSLYEQEEPLDLHGENFHYSKEWEHGTCKSIKDKTVIISVLLNDKKNKWDYQNVMDMWLLQRQLYNLNIAIDWIKESVAEYDCEPEIIYDWKEDEELLYEINTEFKICDNNDEQEVWKIIADVINPDEILEKYEAENILFLICANVPENWMTNSWTWVHQKDDICPYEFCMFYMHLAEEVITPATMAHEILHAFGARDLYMDDMNKNGVTREYMLYLYDHDSEDIMFRTSTKEGERLPDSIANIFTELDAYYLGLTDSSADVEEFDLPSNEF